jgi:hypothetical protein
MSDDDRPEKSLSGEVLPPLKPVPPQVPLVAPFGVGAFTIASNWSQRRQIESYTRLAEAKNQFLRLYNEQCNLLIARGIAQEHLQNLPLILETERLKLRNQVARERMEAGISQLRMSVEIENLRAQLAEAKQRRQRIENPEAPPTPPPEKSDAEKLAEGFAHLNEIDAVMRAQRASFVASRGGEDKLSDEDRDLLDKLEVAHAVEIERLTQDIYSR